MIDAPHCDVFALDERTVVVPDDWGRRFRRAALEDKRNTALKLGVAVEPFDARNAAYGEFIAAAAGGLELETWA